MTTGPEHFQRAEALLGGRNNGGSNGAKTPEEAVALAEVHAILSLTAVLATLVPADGSGKYSRWAMVTDPPEDA